jgi:hypothetical protein
MTPLPWSFSLLELYETCPRKFYEIQVAKSVVDAPSEASDWGNRVHKALDDGITRNVPLEPEMATFQPWLDTVNNWKLSGDVYGEQKLAVNKNLESTSFFAKEVFGRGIVDVVHIFKRNKTTGDTWARVIDWKTGKRKSTNQLMIASLLAFAAYPKVDAVRTDFVWFKELDPKKNLTTGYYSRSEVPNMWEQLLPELKRYREAFKTEQWPERPSGLCNGWCPVKQCKYWRPKRER